VPQPEGWKSGLAGRLSSTGKFVLHLKSYGAFLPFRERIQRYTRKWMKETRNEDDEDAVAAGTNLRQHDDIRDVGLYRGPRRHIGLRLCISRLQGDQPPKRKMASPYQVVANGRNFI